jgi:hypothetical protein
VIGNRSHVSKIRHCHHDRPTQVSDTAGRGKVHPQRHVRAFPNCYPLTLSTSRLDNHAAIRWMKSATAAPR